MQFAYEALALSANGTRSDCTSYPASGCTPIQWPGERTSARHELEPDGRIQNWYGGLVDGMRDASGQMYMRNRYHDPATGQFTQPDPIGLAGGRARHPPGSRPVPLAARGPMRRPVDPESAARYPALFIRRALSSSRNARRLVRSRRSTPP